MSPKRGICRSAKIFGKKEGYLARKRDVGQRQGFVGPNLSLQRKGAITAEAAKLNLYATARSFRMASANCQRYHYLQKPCKISSHSVMLIHVLLSIISINYTKQLYHFYKMCNVSPVKEEETRCCEQETLAKGIIRGGAAIFVKRGRDKNGKLVYLRSKVF